MGLDRRLRVRCGEEPWAGSKSAVTPCPKARSGLMVAEPHSAALIVVARTPRRRRNRRAPAPVPPIPRARWRPLVGRGRGLPAVPCAAVGVDPRIGCLRGRAVSLAPLVRIGRAVHRRPDSGWRNVTAPSSVTNPTNSTARAAVSGIPSSRAARHKRAVSPSGSAAARSSNRRASRGSRASRRRKLCSIPADNGSAAGNPNPPASWPGVSPRGSSRIASGLPPVLATIRSSTDSSSGAARTDSRSLVHHDGPRDLRGAVGNGAGHCLPPGSRTRARSSPRYAALAASYRDDPEEQAAQAAMRRRPAARRFHADAES